MAILTGGDVIIICIRGIRIKKPFFVMRLVVPSRFSHFHRAIIYDTPFLDEEICILNAGGLDAIRLDQIFQAHIPLHIDTYYRDPRHTGTRQFFDLVTPYSLLKKNRFSAKNLENCAFLRCL